MTIEKRDTYQRDTFQLSQIVTKMLSKAHELFSGGQKIQMHHSKLAALARDQYCQTKFHSLTNSNTQKAV